METKQTYTKTMTPIAWWQFQVANDVDVIDMEDVRVDGEKLHRIIFFFRS